MTIKKRKKASDVFNETDYFLGKKTAFEKVFPEIETLKIIVEESGEGLRHGKEVRHFGKDSGEFIHPEYRRYPR